MSNENSETEFEGEEAFVSEPIPKASCTITKVQRSGIYWHATARCADGSSKLGQSVNKEEAKRLACLQCSW